MGGDVIAVALLNRVHVNMAVAVLCFLSFFSLYKHVILYAPETVLLSKSITLFNERTV